LNRIPNVCLSAQEIVLYRRISEIQHLSNLSICVPKLDNRTKQYCAMPQICISTKSPFRYATGVHSFIFLPSFRISLDSLSQVPQKLRKRKMVPVCQLTCWLINPATMK